MDEKAETVDRADIMALRVAELELELAQERHSKRQLEFSVKYKLENGDTVDSSKGVIIRRAV